MFTEILHTFLPAIPLSLTWGMSHYHIATLSYECSELTVSCRCIQSAYLYDWLFDNEKEQCCISDDLNDVYKGMLVETCGQ